MLVEGKAIKIHPLVCTAFNADFDGDQMAVHIPLSPEAQIEASTLMLSANNILSPAHGAPIAVPTQDMVLGLYYLTKSRPGTKGEGRTFASIDDVLIALEMGEVETLTPIKLRYTGRVIDLTKAFDNQNILRTEPIEFAKQYMDTTVGRVILNDVLPDDMPFINGLLKKKGLDAAGAVLLPEVRAADHRRNARRGEEARLPLRDPRRHLHRHRRHGRARIERPAWCRTPRRQVIEVQNQYQEGAITQGERYNKIIEIWSKVTEKVSEEMFKSMEEDDRTGRYLNPIYIMADSGARGSKQQIRQLSGMRGLMAKPSGEIIETPITANFREGLNVLQYFISTHGARKGLADTALKTADSGYLTRRLCDVAQDVIVTETDCGTGDGIDVERDRRIGRNHRAAARPHRRPRGARGLSATTKATSSSSVEPGDHRRSGGADSKRPVSSAVKIRSVLTCESKRGVCQLCYGRNLATGRMVERGEAVGIISAQSIGEPGTQLTMRTFHVGGTATGSAEQSKQDAKSDGFVKFLDINTVRNAKGELIAMNRNGILAIVDDQGPRKGALPSRLRRQDPVRGRRARSRANDDPARVGSVHVLDSDGSQRHGPLQGSASTASRCQEQVDEITGYVAVGGHRLARRKARADDHRAAAAARELDEKRYLMPTHAHLMVRDGEEVHAGDVLAKIPRATTKTKDITGGLPRVVELFEARKPRETAVMREINGIVKFGEIVQEQRKVTSSATMASSKEYPIPRGVHINVQEGERVQVRRSADGRTAQSARHPGRARREGTAEVPGERDPGSLPSAGRQHQRQAPGSHRPPDDALGEGRGYRRHRIPAGRSGRPVQVPRRERSRDRRSGRASGDGQAGAARHHQGVALDRLVHLRGEFQETTRVLTEAAINGKVDYLRGLKENVIMGRLIPAGTGMEYYRKVKIAGEDVVERSRWPSQRLRRRDPGLRRRDPCAVSGGLTEEPGEPLAE